MKKIIILFISILSILIFYQAYQISSQNEYYGYANFPIALDTQNGLNLVSIELSVDNEKDYQDWINVFEQYLDEYSRTGMIQSFEANESSKHIMEYYLYTDNLSLNGLPFSENKVIQYIDNADSLYFSTNNEKANSIPISLLTRSMFMKTGVEVNIHPYKQAIESNGYQSIGRVLCHVYANRPEKVFDQLVDYVAEHSPNSTFQLNHIDFVSDWNEQYHDKVTYINNFVIIVAMVIILLIMTYIIKQSKQVFIMKLHGLSNWYILNHIYLPVIIICNLLFLIIQVILYLLTVGVPSEVSRNFDVMIMSTYGYFTALCIGIYVITYCYLKCFFKARHSLKSDSTALFKLNLVLKVAVAIVTFIPFFATWQTQQPILDSVFMMYVNKDKIANNYTMDNAEDYGNTPLKTLFNDGYYIDYDLYSVYRHDVEGNLPGNYSFAYANDNYLKQFSFSDEQGNVIDLNKLKNGDLLIPYNKVSKEEVDENYFCRGVTCNMFYYQSDVTLLNYSLGVQPHSLKNPVIQFYNAYDPIFQYTSQNLYLPKKHSTKYYQKKVFKDNENAKLSFSDNKNNYGDYEIQRNQAFYEISLIVIICIAIFLSFVYQNVYLYLSDRQKLLAIQYIQGYSKWQRYRFIYMSNLIALLLAGMIGIFILKQPFLLMCQYLIFLSILESFQISLLLYSFQKRSLSQILKGDQS